MYITEINGRQAAYYDDRLEIGDLTIHYNEMMSITHAFEETPVFRFKYKGFDFTIACREDEYEKVLGYFRKAAELSPDTDPLDLLNSVRKHAARKEAEERRAAEEHAEQAAQSRPYNTYNTYNTYNYSSQGSTGNGYGYQEFGDGYEEGVRHYSKTLFVWIGSVLFGMLGIDRFMRGQPFLGILKMITAGGAGYWFLFDGIVAIIKAYGSYKDTDFVHFNADGSYTR